MSDRPIRSMRQFCERYFPKRHAARKCECFPPETPLEAALRRVSTGSQGDREKP